MRVSALIGRSIRSCRQAGDLLAAGQCHRCKRLDLQDCSKMRHEVNRRVGCDVEEANCDWVGGICYFHFLVLAGGVRLGKERARLFVLTAVTGGRSRQKSSQTSAVLQRTILSPNKVRLQCDKGLTIQGLMDGR